MKAFLKKHIRIYYFLIIISCCIFSATSIGIITNCMGLYVTPLANHLSVGLGSITLIITINSLCSAFFAPFLSKLLVKYEIRYILSLGIIINGVTLMLFSIFQNIYIFYFFSIILGISTCCFSLIPVTFILGNWFNKNHGLVTGICISFSGITGALLSPLFNSLINNFGWRFSFLISGLLILILALPFAVFVVRPHPRQVGLPPYGGENYSSKDRKHTQKSSNLKTCRLLTMLCIFYATLISLIVSFNANIASFAASISLPSNIGALMITSCMLGNVLSKIILGFICDRTNAKVANFIMILFATIGLLYIIYIDPQKNHSPLISTFLYGFIFAANATGIPLLIKEIVSPQNYIHIYSIATLFNSTAYAIGVSMFGFSFDLLHSYQPMLIILLIICALCFIILFLIHYFQSQIKSVE